MEILQIIVLILGLVLFTVSFFIPDKQANSKEIREKEEQIFKELVEREIPDICQKLNEEAEGIVESAKENTQRQMERITNEKMMAINEYSDTVMSEIHKNHEEAVFLFDMLNNKHAQVKNTAAELSQVVKQSKQVQAAAKVEKTEKVAEVETKNVVEAPAFEPIASKELEVIIPQELPTEEELMQEVYAEETSSLEVSEQEDGWHDSEEMPEVQKNKVAGPTYTNSDDYDDEYDYEDEYDDYNNVEIMFASENNETTNNDRILELHKAGKSNMAIAKELGLGIGEVKLVIDLFKGGM